MMHAIIPNSASGGMSGRDERRLTCALCLDAFNWSCVVAPGQDMARSDFNWGAEDWELFGPGKLKVYERGGMLYGSVSPPSLRRLSLSFYDFQTCACSFLRSPRVFLTLDSILNLIACSLVLIRTLGERCGISARQRNFSVKRRLLITGS